MPDRGLDVTQPILVVIDGGKALAAAVKAVFDHPIIQRCQLHKIRNVEDHLPDHLASTVAKKMRAAYHDSDPLNAEATLEALAWDLDKSHPGAAGSLREGLADTLTIGWFGVPPTLARTRRQISTDKPSRGTRLGLVVPAAVSLWARIAAATGSGPPSLPLDEHLRDEC
jgi:putative transposase